MRDPAVCRKHSSYVARQVETPGKWTVFAARHDVLVAWRLHYTMTLKLIDNAPETFLDWLPTIATCCIVSCCIRRVYYKT